MDIDLLLYQFQRKWWPLCSPCSPHATMFNLMSNCCTWVSKIQEPIRKVTILVVGLDKAGKTSSIRGMLRGNSTFKLNYFLIVLNVEIQQITHLCLASPVPYSVESGPTQDCVRNELRVENYLVTLLDVGGSAGSREAWKELCAEAHGIIFVVDSSDRHRMKEVKEVLADLLKQPRVAGKPILVLANKQDKMNALLGSELIEMLSLERLVNQSRSLCHIEPCSALMDLRRWSDRKTLRGLRWLLRAVYLDYPELCTRVAQDSKRPLEAREKEKNRKAEKVRRKTKGERMRSSKSDLRQVHRPKDKEKKTKGEGKLQPIRNMLQKETTLKKKLRTKKKKKPVKVKEGETNQEEVNDQEEEEGDGNEAEHEPSGHREKASSALIPPKKGKLKRKTKVKEETLDVPESLDNDDKPLKAKGDKKKKKKVVKVKRKNKINTEGVPAAYSQPVDLSATFDLYRKAILALKERQDQGQ
ncbi:ADP-ribosylation factor-like protein 13A isoform X1 [Thunnus thynnus]|uniref:ADP-ribosylation factor-like protein 13A isoform X1 n=1 Tax=Thunnus thynnus TaxID=8237 RepID=UPI00352811CC